MEIISNFRELNFITATLHAPTDQINEYWRPNSIKANNTNYKNYED